VDTFFRHRHIKQLPVLLLMFRVVIGDNKTPKKIQHHQNSSKIQ